MRSIFKPFKLTAPSFWYAKNMRVISVVLWPFSLIWMAASFIRRLLAKPIAPDILTFCVGNVVLGGGGKTPVVRALVRLLKEQGKSPVILTRGYGGKLRNPVLVSTEKHSVSDVGDEAILLSRDAPCIIARNRVAGIDLASRHGDVIVMDDGLQNPYIRPTRSFLVINGADGIGNGLIFPAGPLREPLEDALQRCVAVIMIGDARQGIPHESDDNLQCGIMPHNSFANKLDDKPVIYARVHAMLPQGMKSGTKVLAFAGIARPERFHITCKELGLLVDDWQAFPDHHAFSQQEILDLCRRAELQGLALVTTEKDAARLPPDMSVHIVPYKVFIDDEIKIYI